MTYKFISEQEGLKVMMSVDNESLDEIVSHFRDFLIGSGFHADSVTEYLNMEGSYYEYKTQEGNKFNDDWDITYDSDI